MASTYRALETSLVEDEGYMTFEEVLAEEHGCIEGKRRMRESGSAEEGVRFSLAFSGGGMRAAAFQAGVLWRLAEEDKLKDVDYFTAVSGGGYITAAFASHCMAEKPPAGPEGVRDWYLKVVAKTLCRMQRNAGDFVRDCVSQPGVPEDGSGCLPRLLDLPLLLLTLLLTLVVLPFFFAVSLLVPFAITMELFFGSALRAAFCLPQSDEGWRAVVRQHAWALYEYSPYPDLVVLLLIVVLAFFVVMLVRRVCPCCRLRHPLMRDGKPVGRKRATKCYLAGYATHAFLKRLIIVLVAVALMPFYTSIYNSMAYRPQYAAAFCREYLDRPVNASSLRKKGCSEYYEDGRPPWWHKDSKFRSMPWWTDGEHTAVRKLPPGKGADFLATHVIHTHSSLRFLKVLFIVVVLSGLLAPIIGAELLKRVLFVAGPLFLFTLTVEVTQFRIYGPLTKNAASTWVWKSFDLWDMLVHYALIACVFLLPFLGELRATFHKYYKRSLHENYFCNGEDVAMQDLADSPYCPFILMTGTCCDYKPPGEEDSISEISFSALHVGGEETGYVRTPFFRTLATCTALTGAGCLDAISLTMSELMTLRFWLEILNLTWGDYIFFQPERSGSKVRLKWLGTKFETFVVPNMMRVPGFLPLMVVYGLFFASWHMMIYPITERPNCGQTRFLFLLAIWLAVFVMGASFYTFLPGCGLLSMSPLIRRLHQLSMYFYRGNHPPHMVYVTDGGVKDCTSVLQLLIRRCERMLLVLAAADPRDELAVLKTAMQVARTLKICSFYDPEDPRRDLDVLFERFRENPDMTCLHLGVSYCWDGPEEGPNTGHLFIVKNRLPKSCRGQPVRPLLAEEELGSKADDEEELPPDWSGLTTDQLGPFGCCDCCHTRGLNCGPKFPHGNFTGYLYLSPQWCNSLMRLGHEISAEAVAKVTSAELPQAGWENHVTPV